MEVPVPPGRTTTSNSKAQTPPAAKAQTPAEIQAKPIKKENPNPFTVPTLSVDEVKTLLEKQPPGTFLLRKVNKFYALVDGNLDYDFGPSGIRLDFVKEDGSWEDMVFLPRDHKNKDQGFELIIKGKNRQEYTEEGQFFTQAEMIARAKQVHPDLSFVIHPLYVKPKAAMYDEETRQKTPPYPWPAGTEAKMDESKVQHSLAKAAAPDEPPTTRHILYERGASTLMQEGKYAKAFKTRALAAEIPLDETHPLFDLDKVRQDIKTQQTPIKACCFSNMDTGALKSGHFTIYPRNIDGEDKDVLQFKISPHVKEELQQTLQVMIDNPESIEEGLKQSPLEDIPVKIKEIDDFFLRSTPSKKRQDRFTPSDAKALEITFEGMGRVIVGNSVQYGNLYNKVQVEIDSNLEPGEGLKRMQRMLSILGIGAIICPQRDEDKERLQVAQLFRAFYPAKALKMERDKEFYTCDVQKLKDAICSAEPEMKNLFDIYFGKDPILKRMRLFEAIFPTPPKDLAERIKKGMSSDEFKEEVEQLYLEDDKRISAALELVDEWDDPRLIEEVEITAGKTAFAFKEISLRMRAAGSYGLIHGVGMRHKEVQKSARVVSQILQNGLLSSDERYSGGLFVEGASSATDLGTGGGDHVFCREINQTLINHKVPITFFPYSGKYQILIDLKILDRAGTYAYSEDLYGAKNPNDPRYVDYQERKNMIEFSKENKTAKNEVMVKDRIPASFITGIVCQTSENKETLIKQLRGDGLITANGEGEDSIFDMPVESFIHVASNLTELYGQPI